MHTHMMDGWACHEDGGGEVNRCQWPGVGVGVEGPTRTTNW